MESKKRSLLGRLRGAISKVRFLLSFRATRWLLSSIMGSGGTPRRVISFNSPRPGLLDVSPIRGGGPSRTASLGATVSRTSSLASSEIASTRSVPASPGDDDIDRRAELFIKQFYERIQMERQVSLQLRYCRENALERTP